MDSTISILKLIIRLIQNINELDEITITEQQIANIISTLNIDEKREIIEIIESILNNININTNQN